MILAKTTEYALSVLAFMATREEMIYSADTLHSQLNIPPKYLRRLLTGLAKKGFIASTRGRRGGFTFTRDLSGINLFEIIAAMEGSDVMNSCPIGLTACLSHTPCVLHDSWTDARDRLKSVLKATSLADLRDKYAGGDTTHNGKKGHKNAGRKPAIPISRIRE